MSLYIHRPSSTRFVARVRRPRCRNYQLVGKETRSYATAILRMSREFAKHDYKRGDVIMTADYYDPVVLCELVRR